MSGHHLQDMRPELHRIIKRAATSTVTRKTTTKVASAAKAIVASTTDSTPTSTFTPGVANTATGTAVAPTTPPSGNTLTTAENSAYSASFANVNSNYVPLVTAPSAAATSGTAASQSAVANSSNTSTTPVLSQGALIGIIAGGGALVLIILSLLIWWCCKKRKAKKAEKAWWGADPGKPTVGGKAVRLVDTDGWAKGAQQQQSGSPFDEKSWEAPRMDYNAPRMDYPASMPQQPQNALQAAQMAVASEKASSYSEWRPDNASARNFQQEQNRSQAGTMRSQREELLSSRATESVNGVISFGQSHRDSERTNNGFGRDPFGSSASVSNMGRSHPSEMGQSKVLYSTNLPPASSPPPARPSRPSELPPPRQRMPSDNDDVSSYGDTFRSKKRQSMARKKDTILNFSDAYQDAGPDNFHWEQHALPSPPMAPAPSSPSKITPPKRGTSVRPPPSFVEPTLAPPTPYRLPTTRDSTINGFPPPPSSQSPSKHDTISTYARVDSKPLKDLEDILDSFAYSSRGERLPPIPDNESLRTMSTISKPAPVQPLNLTRAKEVHDNGLPASPSTNSLFPGSHLQGRYDNPNSYEINHHPISIYSHQGDVGELANSEPNSPTKPEFAGTPSPRNLSPVKATMGAPSIVRSDSRGHAHQYLSDGGKSAFGSMSSTDVSDVEGRTEIVRKVSLSRSAGAPVRVARNESLAPRQPTQAERDVVSQLGFDDSLSSSTSSSTRSSPTFDAPAPLSPASASTAAPGTPRDGLFPPSAQTGKFEQGLSAPGFTPLASMSLDPYHQNYRSATASVYNLYDDYLPTELKGLPQDDPRVSRHLSNVFQTGVQSLT